MKVGEILRLLQDGGWYLVAQRGSHRQFKHETKLGRVTVPGSEAPMRYEREIREAIAFHIEGIQEDGLPVPLPTSTVEYIELAA
jgi:predicted RNA binding protein YcfA (HicA-like mRNA interferase family)